MTALLVLWITALHLGALHPVEKWLTLLLAFGPFVLLGLVIWWRRKHPEDDPGAPRRTE